MAIKYPGCYVCDKIILVPGGKNKTSLGESANVSPDYRSIDVHLSDGNRVIAFATPICKECLKPTLTEDNVKWKGPLVKKISTRLINNCKKEKNWGFGHKFFESQLSVVNVVDLTDELVKSGIISCQ